MSGTLLVLDFPEHPGGTAVRRVFRQPREIIEAYTVDEVIPALSRVEAACAAGSWAAGFLSYEAAPAFEPAMRVRQGGELPLLWFGIFDSFSTTCDDATTAAAPTEWHDGTPDTAHHVAIARIREAIAAGETYQVNYTTRLHATYDGDPFAWYQALREAQADGWHAYVHTDRHAILSASPELFFMRRESRIETRPMKGTRPRGRWLEEDRAQAEALLASSKDRAENLMIVDLLRSDIGRIACNGSVEVPALFAVERYPTVWQLTSRIDGLLKPGTGLVDIFRALFPCGSITGAPKINTMKWIAGLEDSPREVYCGAIGFVAPGGDCTFNVPIRTVWLDRETHRAVYGTGAGITIDSDAAEELAEFRSKAAILDHSVPSFELLETMRVEDGVILRRALHVERLTATAEYFGYNVNHTGLQRRLDTEATAAAGAHRLRLLTARDGGIRVERSATPPSRYADRDACRAAGGIEDVVLNTQATDSRSPFLCHKTTHRVLYDAAREASPDAFDVLLWNERGELTEFTTGNVVAERDGELLTPARSCGLLNGTFRSELLQSGTVKEVVLFVDDLERCNRVWLVNSVREWLEVRLLR